ncbi:tRNA1(Val) (adenine(37)-N6)-methyltransferase [Hwanghaeella grinnelliae]|uniref:tRNA1(Val) (adenine(37)-N6)-methyltransferase n=1 Tax=Hwanghaeella grinnelliae TaxID=2500179 RepID=UPI001F01F843|nr:methyltransferase [Hwanghaeella grinnelliae]
MDLTDDSLLNGSVRLRQKRDGYRVAIDSVLLAAAVPLARPSGRVLDLGTGTGAALLCYLHRVRDASGLGVEIDVDAAAIARTNAELNGFADRMTVSEADIRNLAALPGEMPPFDQVFTNPPYMEALSADKSPIADKARSNVESAATIAEWIGAGLALLRHKGGFTVIHRADRLDAILAALHGKAGDVEIIPLWPRAGVAAKRVIVRARKGVRGGATLLPGLVLHGNGQAYTAQADAVLQRGESFP